MSNENYANWTRAFRYGLRAVVLAAIISNGSAPIDAAAQDISAMRKEGLTEVSPLFLRKQVEINANLVSTSGPEFWEQAFGKPLYGCPESPVTDAGQALSLRFSTGDAGAWAGDLDGINTSINKPTGAKGGGFAIPSNSSSRLSDAQSGPEFEFSFDGTIDLKRSLIDAAAEQIDQCVSKLPPGSYPGDELSRLCPVPSVTRAQQKQTCVPVVNGVIGEKLADGSGYKVTINQQTMCDFIGYGRPNESNTGFTSCFQQRYEGVAKISGGQPSAKARALKAASNRAFRDCGRSSRKRNATKVAQCVKASMLKSMSGTIR